MSLGFFVWWAQGSWGQTRNCKAAWGLSSEFARLPLGPVGQSGVWARWGRAQGLGSRRGTLLPGTHPLLPPPHLHRLTSPFSSIWVTSLAGGAMGKRPMRLATGACESQEFLHIL